MGVEAGWAQTQGNQAGIEPYKLVMSEDDGLCKPLARLYNRNRKTNPPPSYGPLSPVYTPEELYEIGLKKPPSVNGIYKYDVFNNGEEKFVAIKKYAHHITSITIGNVETDIDEGIDKYSFDDTLGIDDRTGFFTKKLNGRQLQHGNNYILKRYPYKNNNIEQNGSHKYIRSVMTGVTTGLFIYNGRSIFISSGISMKFIDNGYYQDLSGPALSTILVYELTKLGPNDLCYIVESYK
jgi:hypothetical protein